MGLVHQELVDAALGEGVSPRFLPHVNDLGPGPRAPQKFRARQLVINDDVAPGQKLQGLHRHQTRIPGPGPHQVDFALHTDYAFASQRECLVGGGQGQRWPLPSPPRPLPTL